MSKSPHIRVVTATEAKNRFGAIIKSAYAFDEHLIVEKSGIPVVAIIPMADYQALVSQREAPAEITERISTEQRRAKAGRELRELLAEIHAEMPTIPPEEEEDVERLIQQEVDAVRRNAPRKESANRALTTKITERRGPEMTRAVLDTNVLVSALIIDYGKPAQLVGGTLPQEKFILVISDEIIQETNTTLHRKHIQKRFHPTEEKINQFLDKLLSLGEFVKITDVENLVPQDPPDNLILATAVHGNADYLISGNLHLLDLISHRNIKIVTPAKFLSILNALQSTQETNP